MIIFRNTFFIICCLNTFLFASVKQDRLDLSNNELQYIRNNPIVTVGVLENFDPFSYKEDGKEEGLSIDVLKRVQKLTGLKFKLKTKKWHTLLNDFKTGKLDVIADISYTKKREKFTLFTKPYYEIPTYIFGLENDTKFKQNIDFKDKVVAVSKGMFYIDKLKNLGIKVLELESSIEKAKAVVEGRADYFFASYTTGVKAIRNSSLTSLKALGEFYGIKREDLRFGINKDKRVLKSIFDKAMAKVSQKELKEYANRWIVFRQEYKSYKKLDFTEEEQKYLDTKPVIRYSEVDWRPFSIIDDNKMKGIMKDFLDVIEKRTGLKFKYIPASSWTNVLDMFKKSSIDMIPGIGSSGKENLMGILSKKYAKYPIVIVTGKKYTYIDNLNDIKDKTVAIPKNYTTYNLIKKNYPKIKLIETKDVEDALLLVENGRADAFVGHIAVAIHYISELHLEDLKVSGTTVFDFEHHILVQKNNPVLLSIINKTIDSISFKEKKEIYSNWIQSTVIEKAVDYTSIFSIIFITLLIVAAFSYRQHLLKKYNRKLKQSYQDIESIINTAMEAIVISEKGVCVDVNDSALRIMNCESKDEIIGKKLLYFVSAKDQELVKQKMRKTIVEPYELELLSLDRKKFPALIRARDLELNEKQVRITSVIDLSEIKSKERLLIEQSKMAALGEMIGHIAHQWRQPLSIITTITSSWEIYNELGDFDKEKVLSESKAILTNAKYLSQTIDDFRVFIKGENTLKEFNIRELLDNLTRLVTPSLQNSQIKFIVSNHLEKDFKGGINEILQALINIINNSMDALNENLTSNEDKLIFIDTFEKNNYVCINIKDNAGGIKEDIKQKIFEPYFTTKHESNGTGLGLYMTYSIIEKMSGKIEVSNVNYKYEGNSYKGANFLICLKL